MTTTPAAKIAAILAPFAADPVADVLATASRTALASVKARHAAGKLRARDIHAFTVQRARAEVGQLLGRMPTADEERALSECIKVLAGA